MQWKINVLHILVKMGDIVAIHLVRMAEDSSVNVLEDGRVIHVPKVLLFLFSIPVSIKSSRLILK